MTPGEDAEWIKTVALYRKANGFNRMTPEEAEVAYNSAPSISMSGEEIDRVVNGIMDRIERGGVADESGAD